MPTETIKMHPIFARDIFADGSSRPAPDDAPTPIDGATYRWIHIDLSDGALSRWCAKHLPAQAARTLLAAKTRPRVDVDGDGLVLTLRGINMNDGFEQADMVSLRMWVTATLVVTVRRQPVFAMTDMHTQMDADDAPSTTMKLVAQVAANLVARVETVSLSLEDLVDDLENQVYEDKRVLTRDLAPSRRQAIKMRRHIGPMADALRNLSYVETQMIPASLRLQLRDTASSARRALEELSEVQDRLTALVDHLDMAQASRLERNGYRLSVAAGIFLPLGFMTSLFGVNLGGIPGLENPDAFWLFTSAMVIFGIVIGIVLKLRRWL